MDVALLLSSLVGDSGGIEDLRFALILATIRQRRKHLLMNSPKYLLHLFVC